MNSGQLTHRALLNEADRLRRAAGSRKWGGPRNREYRATMREEAAHCEELAQTYRNNQRAFIQIISAHAVSPSAGTLDGCICGGIGGTIGGHSKYCPWTMRH